MSMKFWKLNKGYLLLLVGVSAWAGDFQYFKGEIDYWNDQPKKELAAPTPVGKTKGEESPLENNKFLWAKFLDPKNKEFFKEGEYTPPEPFMEIVRNPSDENLRLWFSYIDKKNELAQRLDTRMKDYVASHGLMASNEREILLATGNRLPKLSQLTKRFRFRMYFDSKCPHCKKMMGTMEDLQSKGFLVEARQVDSGETLAVPFPVVRASPKEVTEKEVSSVPLLLIGDLQRKVVYRLSGFQSTQDVLSALQREGGT